MNPNCKIESSNQKAYFSKIYQNAHKDVLSKSESQTRYELVIFLCEDLAWAVLQTLFLSLHLKLSQKHLKTLRNVLILHIYLKYIKYY